MSVSTGCGRRNLLTASMKAIPKAAYGWFCGNTSEATFHQVDRAIAQVGPDPRMGDASLKTLQLVMAAWRRALKQGTAPGEWREHGWTRNLRNFMKSIGCKETTNWRWCTSQGGTIDLNPESDDFDETNGLMAHRIREAWRKTLFDRWRVRARIDAKLCATQTYCEERCAMTRKLVGTDGHKFAVAAGAAVGPQRYVLTGQDSKQGRTETADCPWCGPCVQGQGPDWEHMCWKCTMSGRPPELYPPSDPLQKRLGWAVTTEPPWYNTAVLEWMAEVRRRILDIRHDREGKHTFCLKRQVSMPCDAQPDAKRRILGDTPTV